MGGLLACYVWYSEPAQPDPSVVARTIARSSFWPSTSIVVTTRSLIIIEIL